MIARQYAENFHTIFEQGVPALLRGIETTGSLEGGIIAGDKFYPKGDAKPEPLPKIEGDFSRGPDTGANDGDSHG